MTQTLPELRPNTLPRKGVAQPKFDLESIWEALRFAPHSGQQTIFKGWKFHQQTTAVCGTRFGKSEFAAHLPLGHILPCWRYEIRDNRRVAVDHWSKGAVVAPIYKLTQIVMGKLLVNIVKLMPILGYAGLIPKKGKPWINLEDPDAEAEPGKLTVRRINGVIREIITPWGSNIQAFTMDDPRSLLGLAFDWIITDESGQFNDQDWENFEEYALRALADFRGWVYHGSTPKGFNGLYENPYREGLAGDPKKLPSAISFQMPSHTNPVLDKGWLADMEARSNPRIWRQNFLAMFEVMAGQVYEEFGRDTHVRKFEPQAKWGYFLGMDFGFTDPFVALLMAWTGEEFVVIAEIYQAQLDTPEQRARVRQLIKTFVPPGAAWLVPNPRDRRQPVIWGDPRGGQNRADWAQLGQPIRKPRMILRAGQKGSIEETAQVVAEYVHPTPTHAYPTWAAQPGDQGKPAPRLLVHPRCTQTIRSLETWVKVGEKYKGDDHPSDALRYATLGARPFLKDWTANHAPGAVNHGDNRPSGIRVRQIKPGKGWPESGTTLMGKRAVTTQELLDAALRAAMGFFQVSDEWLFQVNAAPLEGMCAEIEVQGRILRVILNVDPRRCSDPHEMWTAVGHELAHFSHREVIDALYLWDDQWPPNHPLRVQLEHAIETNAIRLERVFAQHCPMPDHFQRVKMPPPLTAPEEVKDGHP